MNNVRAASALSYTRSRRMAYASSDKPRTESLHRSATWNEADVGL